MLWRHNTDSLLIHSTTTPPPAGPRTIRTSPRRRRRRPRASPTPARAATRGGTPRPRTSRLRTRSGCSAPGSRTRSSGAGRFWTRRARTRMRRTGGGRCSQRGGDALRCFFLNCDIAPLLVLPDLYSLVSSMRFGGVRPTTLTSEVRTENAPLILSPLLNPAERGRGLGAVPAARVHPRRAERPAGDVRLVRAAAIPFPPSGSRWFSRRVHSQLFGETGLGYRCVPFKGCAAEAIVLRRGVPPRPATSCRYRSQPVIGYPQAPAEPGANPNPPSALACPAPPPPTGVALSRASCLPPATPAAAQRRAN